MSNRAPTRPNTLWLAHATAILLPAVLLAGICSAQSSMKPTLIVLAFEDDAPVKLARVVIEPLGPVSDWPTKTNKMELDADRKGRLEVKLGSGLYRVTATNPAGVRLPAGANVTISDIRKDPLEIRLVLQYWDCAKVRCEL